MHLLLFLFWCSGTIPSSGTNSEVLISYGITAKQTKNSWYQFQNVLWNVEEYRELLNKKKSPYPRFTAGGAAGVSSLPSNDSYSFSPKSPLGTIFTGYKIPLRI